MKNIKDIIISILRILLGIVFIISAIMKLISMDSFEIYIYSLNITSLNVSFILARLVISFEFIIGVLLILKIFLRTTILLSILSLFGFILFISYLILSKNSEHCHCFGDALQISHGVSILKNAILIILLLLINTKALAKIKYQKIYLGVVIIIGIITPFIISTPDSFMIENYAEKSTYNEIALNNFVKDYNYEKGKHVICFFGASCRFCKLSVKKIDVISKNINHPELISHVFWGSKEQVEEFYVITNTSKLKYMTIPGSTFLKITDGKMPLIVLIDNGKIKAKYGYRDIVEDEVLEFLK